MKQFKYNPYFWLSLAAFPITLICFSALLLGRARELLIAIALLILIAAAEGGIFLLYSYYMGVGGKLQEWKVNLGYPMVGLALWILIIMNSILFTTGISFIIAIFCFTLTFSILYILESLSNKFSKKHKNDRSLEEIYRIIEDSFQRPVKISYRYDTEMDVYFFYVGTDEEHFVNDFEIMQTYDNKLKTITYNGKKVIGTIEDEINM